MANNGEYLAKLVNDHGVQVRAFNDDVWDAMGEAAAEVFTKKPVRILSLRHEIDDSFQATLREYGTLHEAFEGTYVNQRNRVLGIEA